MKHLSCICCYWSVKNHQNTSWLKDSEQNWLVKTDAMLMFCLVCAGRSTPWCSMSLCCCSWAGGMWRGLVCLDPAVTAAPTARPPSPLMTGTNTRITVIVWSLQHDDNYNHELSPAVWSFSSRARRNQTTVLMWMLDRYLSCCTGTWEISVLYSSHWCIRSILSFTWAFCVLVFQVAL